MKVDQKKSCESISLRGPNDFYGVYIFYMTEEQFNVNVNKKFFYIA